MLGDGEGLGEAGATEVLAVEERDGGRDALVEGRRGSRSEGGEGDGGEELHVDGEKK